VVQQEPPRAPAVRQPQPQAPPVAAPVQQAEPEPTVEAPGSVFIRSNIEGSILFVNDQPHGIIGGRGNQTIELPAGQLRLSLRAEGCTNWDSTVTVRAGERTSVGNRNPRC
jgi:hypothetical protein